jgi:hypothetical protein
MPNLRLKRKVSARTLRVLGGVLLLLGIATAVVGAIVFMRGFMADDFDTMGRLALVGVLVFGCGGIVTGLGVSALGAGFAARARYVETTPVGRAAPRGLADDLLGGRPRSRSDRPRPTG